MVLQGREKVEGFKVVGAGLLRPSGADVKIAQIDERVGDGLVVLFDPLQVKHFLIAGFSPVEIAGHGADVAEVAQRL